MRISASRRARENEKLKAKSGKKMGERRRIKAKNVVGKIVNRLYSIIDTVSVSPKFHQICGCAQSALGTKTRCRWMAEVCSSVSICLVKMRITIYTAPPQVASAGRSRPYTFELLEIRNVRELL